MNPEVSVIIPCYQQGKYLRETLSSIEHQIFANWECLIINDGSKDETETVAQEFCKKDIRFKYFFQENSGVSAARNNGVSRALGSYIQFLDGDDMLEPNKIGAQVDFLNDYPQVSIIYGSSRYFLDGNPKDLFAVNINGNPPSVELNYTDTHQDLVLIHNNVATICATMYRKEVFEQLTFKPIVFEDYLFHIECALNGFCFHYERAQNANCLIRITTESQMMKHVLLNNKNNEFQDTVKALILKHNFISPFEKPEIQNEIHLKPNIYLRILKNITPPILFKLQRLFK